MELLLALLSLLTAATGALTGARAPDAGLQQAAQVDTIRTAAPHATRAARATLTIPVETPTRLSRAAVPVAQALAVARSIPLYADHLIE